VTLSLEGCRKILLHGQNNRSSLFVVFGNLEPYARVWLCRLRCPWTRLVYPGRNLHLVISKKNLSIGYLKSLCTAARISSFFHLQILFKVILYIVLGLDICWLLPMSEWLWLELKYLTIFSYKWEHLDTKSCATRFLLNKRFANNYVSWHICVKYPVLGISGNQKYIICKNLHRMSTFSHFRNSIFDQDFIDA
jgi:hypothetical protein